MPKTSLDTSKSPQAAIEAALKLNWKEAVKINLELVKNSKSDIDALNRLGFAYLKLGQMTAARRTFDKVLKLDPYNQIALKNSKRAGVVKRKDMTSQKGIPISPLLFLEDPGKTKIVALVNPPPSYVLQTLASGQEVSLRPRNHVVEIRSDKNVYLGVLPDDLSFRLLRLVSAGNQYQVHVKSIGKNSLTVIIREIARGKRFADHPTFTASHAILPHQRATSESVAPDVTPTGEEDDSRVSQE